MASNKPNRKQIIEERHRIKKEAEQKALAQKKKQNTILFVGVLATILAFSLIVVLIWQPWDNSGNRTVSKSSDFEDSSESWVFKHDISVKHHVEIDVKDYGVIKIELDPTYAPITVDNFLNLAEEGFYNGLTFHRIIDGFMIQGGDPKHDGTGGSTPKIKGEFSNNGVNNPVSHKRGVVSMARLGGDNNSASCQFFIVQEDSTHLDNQYAAFGFVTEGMDVVDEIVKNVPTTGGNGAVAYEEQPVIKSIKVID